MYDITADSTPREVFPPVFEPPAFMKKEGGITAMSMGSALHKVTEMIDYENHRTPAAIDGLILMLAEKNLITQEEAAAIDRTKILALVDSPLANRMRTAAASGKLYRETPFVLALPATQLFDEETEDTILVHGIIDCHFEENGKLILVDFKSDKISVPLEKWAQNHRTQLEIYKQALTQAAKMEVAEVLLYSFSHGDTYTFDF
jgi:ATP-dependent helicase/nuclease subunit A